MPTLLNIYVHCGSRYSKHVHTYTVNSGLSAPETGAALEVLTIADRQLLTKSNEPKFCCGIIKLLLNSSKEPNALLIASAILPVGVTPPAFGAKQFQ